MPQSDEAARHLSFLVAGGSALSGARSSGCVHRAHAVSGAVVAAAVGCCGLHDIAKHVLA